MKEYEEDLEERVISANWQNMKHDQRQGIKKAGISDNQQRLTTVYRTATGGRIHSAESSEATTKNNRSNRWHNKELRIGTLNVRTMYQSGKNC